MQPSAKISRNMKLELNQLDDNDLMLINFASVLLLTEAASLAVDIWTWLDVSEKDLPLLTVAPSLAADTWTWPDAPDKDLRMMRSWRFSESAGKRDALASFLRSLRSADA
jgi:hypothetical protein